MTKNIKEIRIWDDNPDKTRTSHIVRIDFNFPCTWTTLEIDELCQILRLWIIGEEKRYPIEDGYKGRWLLFEKIKEVFEENKSEVQQ